MPKQKKDGPPLKPTKTFGEVERLEQADKHLSYTLIKKNIPAGERPPLIAPSRTTALTEMRRSRDPRLDEHYCLVSELCKSLSRKCFLWNWNDHCTIKITELAEEQISFCGFKNITKHNACRGKALKFPA